MLLDTSVAVDLRDRKGAALDRIAALNEPLNLAVVSLVELEGGVYATPRFTDMRRARLDEMLASLDVIDFDLRCAARYRQIVAAAGYSRRKVVDRMIAATALAHGLTLATLDAADFRDVPGLRLELW